MSDSAIYDPHAAEPLPDLPTPATRIRYTTCKTKTSGFSRTFGKPLATLSSSEVSARRRRRALPAAAQTRARQPCCEDAGSGFHYVT